MTAGYSDFGDRKEVFMSTRGHMRVEIDLETGTVISATRPPNAINVCGQLGGHAA